MGEGKGERNRLDRLVGRRGAVIRAEIRWREGTEVEGFVIQANLVRLQDLTAEPSDEAGRPVVGVELGIQTPPFEAEDPLLAEGPQAEWLLDLEEAREIAGRIELLCAQVAPVAEDSPLVSVTYGARDDLTLAVYLPLEQGPRAWSASIRTPEWSAECPVSVLVAIRRQLQAALRRAGR
jgi:hypothetical protein